MLVVVCSGLLKDTVETKDVLLIIRLFIAPPLYLLFVGDERFQVDVLELTQPLSEVLVLSLALLHDLLYCQIRVRARVHCRPAVLWISQVQELTGVN